MLFLLHLILFLIPSPTLLSHSASVPSESQPIKMVISEQCVSDPNEVQGREVDLIPGSPLVLTHRIHLVPGSASGSCCQSEFGALRERIEGLEREVSDLREKCGGVDGGCCTSQQSKGVGCTTSTDECLNDCSDQGRCVDGKCVCFPGFSGPDCSVPDCPGNCSKKGKCVNGKCVCDQGFTGPDCSVKTCPKNCSSHGRCVNGRCVCNTGFTGPDCSERTCPGNCNNKGRCVNGKCVCDTGFAGPDCSERSCPGNCNNKGRCVNGKCVCDTGFTGPDCSERSCPGNCNNKGRCVNGKCVCDTGFKGPDCSERSCPGNCNNKGRCVNGKCVCDTGFMGPDCSERSCPGNCNNKGRCVNGKCVCDTGFAGPDCSERSCPGNCNNKGRCVNGNCVCDTGFAGPDCSERSCPGNCNNKGRCVNGKCVCDTGFTGPDCSERSCPGNCNNKGKCVNGKCVCDTGFTGPDCSERSCPGNCNNKGRCVNGQCVCEVGFTGPDCSTKSCPNNCSNRGRCVNGKCVCNPGFAEPDCSECKDGFTGPDCTTALIAVSHLGARNITESSVTLFWTPPTVQYNTYHITFTSEKESDQKITATVNGRLISYTQVGLAPGQRYTVTIVGEKDGKMGSQSMTTFQTLISGPKNLQVAKTSTTSVIVQWEEAQGEIDRYILSFSPNQTDGSGKSSQEMRLPPGRDSAQIDGLEPGRLYDISLVAVKDDTQSLPANVQATPDRVAGFSDEVRPLDGNGPKLQDGRLEEYPIKERQEENQVIHQQEEGALEMATLSEHPKRISIEEMEAGTTPSPSLPLAMTLVPSETQEKYTNSGQATSRDRHHTKTSLQLPPSFKYRYSSRPKVSGSSTSPINSRQSTASISSTNSSQMPEYKILFGNVSSLQTSYPIGMEKETLKMKTTASQVSQPDDQGLLTKSQQGLDRDSSVANIPESIKDTANRADGDNLPKRKETINKTAPLYHRTPHRGTFPRRPNIGPFQNRTSPFQHRSPLRKPLLPRVNITASIKGEPVIRQSVLNPNHTQVFTWQRKNGTVIRFPPKPINKIKPNHKGSNDKVSKADAPLDKNTSKESNIFLPEDNDANPIFNLSLSIDKSLAKKDDTMQPVSGSSESTIDHILPRVTNRYSTTGKTIPRHQRVSGVFRGRQNVSSLKIRPTFIQIRKNNTVIRLPTNLRTEENVPASNIYSLQKDSKYESRHKHAKDPKKEPRIGLPTDADINLFDTITVSTEKPPVGTYQTLQTINEGSQNTIDHTNKEHSLHRLTTRYQNLSRVTNRDHKLPRVPLRDLEISKMQTMQTIIDQKVGSEIPGHRENVPNQNLRSRVLLRRKDGTIVRFQPKLHTQIKPNFTSIHSGLKEADANVVKDAKESVTDTTDRHTAESYYEPKTAAVNTEVSNDNILPSVTNRGPQRNANRDHHVSRVTKDQDLPSNTNREDSTTIKPVNNQNGPSETFGSEENVPNQNLGPTFMQSNSGRFQPKLHDQIKLNSSTIQSGLIATEDRVEKGSKKSTAFTVPAVGVASEGDTEFNSTGQNPNFTTKFTMKKNNGTVFRHKLKPKIKPNLHGDPKRSTDSNSTKITSPQNTINHNSRPNISLQRKTGTIVRLPPKVFPQLKPKSTTIHDVTGGSKNSTEDPKLGWSPEGPLSTDKATSQRNTTFQPLSEDNINHVQIQNVTSKGFLIIWVAPEGRFKNFVIRIIEEIDEEVNEGVGSKQEERKERTEGNKMSSNVIEVVRRNSSIDEVRKKFIKLLPGSARLYPVTDLTSQTNYSVTLYGTGPGLRSNIHTFIITTGPEPPSHLSFTDITDTSLTVSWRRPKSSVSGFKVTYIHTKEGEPISVMVDSSSSTLSLTKLSPGSPYEVSVISVLGLDESDAIKKMVITMPDPPTDLRAINITDTKALLVWRPALATVDQYIITYRSEEAPGSELSIRVSGNAVEQQLQTLKSSTKYSVNIVSRLGDQKSSSTHTTFITASGSPGKGESPRDLTAEHVTARTALLSWKPPASAVTSYKLTYFTKGGERKEVTLNPGVAEHKLRGLRPSSTYTALLQGERGGVYTAAISTDFTTGSLHFPYPSDCSQELLNGELESGLVEIFPGGKDGQSVMVYCDMETDGGGWTVFQRRKDGKTNFFRGWQEYRKGFGDLEGEFWLGNDFLHNLTTMMPMTMRVDLRSENEAVFAHYSTFSVDTMKKHYMLRLSGYSGTAGDSLRYHDKRPFSTHDRDPQPFITRCAMSYRGGWWYKNCHEANLNGLYNTHTNHQGVIWTAWKGKKYSIPFSEMKLRPASFKSHSQG
ncbi:tenascin-like isoform X1 [Tachysurus vachellii]|uniref:tenascin-like isoform X1 n=1 Tax=Tachysurus vachellii TaxID=175792 RepID=UPI00296AAED9|nr:tenascin-like isoform X1 [Tachysurus vachellii]